MNDNIDELDTTWIQEFEKIDNQFKNYYTELLSFVKIRFVYINSDNNIEKLKEDKVLLKTPGVLLKDELLGIIKHNSFSNNTKYSLLSILKFNLNVEPIHLTNFLKNKDPLIGCSFLQSVKNIDNIVFEKSISMFHDINELVILFYKKANVSQIPRHCTKKITIHSSSNLKKTKKKELKENTT